MPLIEITMYPGRTIEQKRELAEAITRETVRIAKCSPQAVDIIFHEVPKEHWANAGKLASDT